MSDDEASSSESDTELRPEDSLVQGRAKRSTAGNRLSVLLQAYGDEDVQNDLLKDEEEDAIDYEASDDGGDVDLESSDESDDQGPPKEGQEETLEGEKELQKQERSAARIKKRKAQTFLNIPRPKKKIKPPQDTTVALTTDTPPEPRQRKKSERISWLPTADELPTRQSNRNATVLNKTLTEVKLLESQKRSEKTHEQLRLAAEKRAANAKPALTQAERIARALKTEKENSKSLNRWVQVEEERRALQKKKMEAMRNRQIEGPVITYWSASAIWEGDRIKVKRVHRPLVEVVEPAHHENQTVAPAPAPINAPDSQNKAADSTGPHNLNESSNGPIIASTSVNSNEASSDPNINPGLASHASKIAIEPNNTPHLNNAQEQEIPGKGVDGEPVKIIVEEHDAMDIDSAKTSSGTNSKPVESQSAEPVIDIPTNRMIERPTDTAKSGNTFMDEIEYWASQSPVETEAKIEPPLAATKSESAPATQPLPIASESAPLHAIPTAEDAATVIQLEQPSAVPTANVYGPNTIVVTQPPNTFASAPPYVFPGYSALYKHPDVTPITPASPAPPAIPLLREQALRTLLTLSAFPELDNLPAAPTTTSSRSKPGPAPSATAITSILLPSSHPPLTAAEARYLTARSLKKKGDNLLPDRPPKAVCCITAKDAKFRDPKTGLGYRDLAAFKSLQRILADGCAWSVYEDCWVGIVGDGRMGRVAQGVPEGFWSGVLPPPPKKDVVKLEESGAASGVSSSSAAPLASSVNAQVQVSAALPQAPRT